MFKNIFFAVGTIVLLALCVALLPIDKINWGRISILPAATITVTGTAQSSQANQIASFNASITASNDDKQKATDEVNTKMTALISAVKNFGVPDADIKTQQISVYQQPAPYVVQGQPQTQIYPVPPINRRSGQWYATNSIEITLRDVSKASGLSDILNKSGLTNVYGPNLTVDPNDNKGDTDLLAKAILDARSKADTIAKAGGTSVGKMINVVEGGNNYPIPYLDMRASAVKESSAPIQPGTSTLYKSVTVTFELK